MFQRRTARVRPGGDPSECGALVRPELETQSHEATKPMLDPIGDRIRGPIDEESGYFCVRIQTANDAFD
jgi:hypothetical protein